MRKTPNMLRGGKSRPMVMPGRPAGGPMIARGPAAMPAQSASAGSAPAGPMTQQGSMDAIRATAQPQQLPAGFTGRPMQPPGPMGMKKGGKVAKKAAGGAVKGYAKGGMASRGDGCCMKGKTKGTMK